MTLTDLCEELRNWFDVSRHIGHFKIENGTIELPFLKEGQFFRIVGSVFNDGVHQYPEYGLTDEEFYGGVWALAVPQNVLDLVDEISKWESENAKIINSPYTSESFGGYSYSKATSGGENVTWQSHFKKRLSRWRKI